MDEILLIREIRAKIANHIHYKVNGDNWEEHKYLLEVIERVDKYLKDRDSEYDNT